MKCAAATLAIFVTVTSTAAAQTVIAPDNIAGLGEQSSSSVPGNVLAPVSVVEGPGVKIGEGTVLHPILGLETGLVTNTFYTDRNPAMAGLLRVVAQVATASLSPQRLQPTQPQSTEMASQNVGALSYRAALRLSYDFYLSGNDDVQDQGGLGAAALLRGTLYPKGPWSILFLENFERVLRAPNFESPARLNRDINQFALGVRFAPQSRTLSGLLHYENLIDFFEDSESRFANRFQNSVGLTVAWRFRPVTVFYGDVTQGVFTGLGADSTKVTAFPLTVSAGVQTLFTLKTTLVGRVGYTNGFYSTGPSYSAALGGLQLGYRYSPVGRVTVMYDYLHQDSINANFYRDHAFALGLEQQLDPVQLVAQGEARYRTYEGVQNVVPAASSDVRNDLILAGQVGLRYIFRDAYAVVLEWRVTSDSTNFRYMTDGIVDDPSYVRHEIVAGIRAAL